MIKLLKTNFFKMFHSWSFWLTLLLIPFINISIIITKSDEYSGRIENQMYDRWSVIQCPDSCFNHLSYLIFIMILLVGVLIGDEYSSGAIRNKLAAGYSRIQLYTSYLLTSILECFLVHIFCATVCYGICSAAYGYDGNILSFIYMLLSTLTSVAALAAFTLFCIAAVGDRTIGMITALIADMIVNLVFGGYISSRNTLADADISEFSHKICIIIDSLLPSSYCEWFFNPTQKIKYLRTDIMPSCGWCMLTMVFFCIIGIIVFENKDMK